MTKEEFYQYYIVEDHTRAETALQFNITPLSVSWYTKKWGFRKKAYQSRSSSKKITIQKCLTCGKEFTYSYRKRLFCSTKCRGEYKHQSRYQFYLNNQGSFYGQQTMRNFYKEFLAEQSGRCAICGLSTTWNNKPITFIIDHIDGNADNNNRDNLRLICPNCDSQLDTYKSKNKNSARRKHRMDRISLYDPKI